MSASAVEQILARVAALLTGTTRAGARVYRARQAPFGQDELPAINAHRTPTETALHAEHLARTLVAFELDLHDQGEPWETVVDAFHMDVHALLTADAALAALGRGLLCVGTEPLADEANFLAGKLTARYQIHVLTRPGDLTRSIT